MSENTNIEWCDSTFNPWIGCTKVSPACDHCYAERLDGRGIFGGAHWGPGVARKRTSADNWRKPVQWHQNAHRFCGCRECGWRGETPAKNWTCPSCGQRALDATRRRVFCASLADMLDTEAELEWFVDALDLMRICTNLDFLFLTKRIGNLLRRLNEALFHVMDNPDRKELSGWIARWIKGIPPANVWLGITVCNQQEADRDIPKLLAVPAAVRFLSIEPMLGPIDLRRWVYRREREISRAMNGPAACNRDQAESVIPDPGIHWVIAGGESGPQARPSHPEWFRSLRDQCKAAGVPFLFKQWGEFSPVAPEDIRKPHSECISAAGEVAYLAFSNNPVGWVRMYRIGKQQAGRLLDGVTHDGFPEVQP